MKLHPEISASWLAVYVCFLLSVAGGDTKPASKNMEPASPVSNTGIQISEDSSISSIRNNGPSVDTHSVEKNFYVTHE